MSAARPNPRLTVGQAVVTDPGGGRSSGYVLLDASESVAAEDAQHLTQVPQITDFLHTEESPGTFFSFYRLPSGAWALVKRFVAGRRRGAFNRIVVYSWVMGEPVLAAVADEPWLLLTACRFRPVDRSEEQTPADLGKQAARVDLHGLEDLECRPPAAPEADRAAVQQRRREVLLKELGRRELETWLGDVYAGLVAGRPVLLPAGRIHQQLLLFAWSALPVADRLATPWTTHLAAAAGPLFRLANQPASHVGHSRQEAWCRPPDDRPPEDAAGGAGALAAAAAGGLLPAPAVDADFRRHQTRQSTQSARVRRRLAKLRRGEALRLEGLPDPRGLASFLEDFRLAGDDEEIDPWLDPSDVLAWACGAVLHLADAGRAMETAVTEVYKALDDAHWGRQLLAPEAVARDCRAPADALGDRAVPVAVALALRGSADRLEPQEALLAVLLGVRERLSSAEARTVLIPVLVTLALALARGGSPRRREALAALAEVPGGLEAARERLGRLPRPEDLGAALALLDAAREAGHGELAGELAGRLVDLAVHRPELAGQIAELRLAESLAAMELPPDVWLPVALVEADRVDSRVSPHGRFFDRLRLDDRRSAERVLGKVREKARDGSLGEGHRLLVHAVAAGLGQVPDQAAEALGQLDGVSDGAFLRWGDTLADVAAALEQAGAPSQASALCRAWLVQLATRSWKEIPLAARRLFGSLTGDDRRTVVDLWLPKVSGMGAKLGEDDFVAALAALAREHPEQRFKLSVQLLARQVAALELSLVEAVRRADRMARKHEPWQPWLARAVKILLPREPRERAAAVMRLLLARKLPAATRRVIDDEFRQLSLRNAGAELAEVVPPVRDFGVRGKLLLEVAKQLGRVWSGDVENVEGFLRQAAFAKRWDAVEAFLAVAERGENSFLKDLAVAGDPTLFRQIRQAARRSPSLKPYAASLGRLERAFEQRTT